MLNEKNIERLASLDIRGFQVTLDGPKEVHDSRRPLLNGKGTYRQIIENLKNFKNFSSLQVKIRVNVDRESANKVTPLLKQLTEEGLSARKNIGVYFTPTHALTSSCQNIACSCFASHEFARKEIEYLQNAIRSKIPTRGLGSMRSSCGGCVATMPNSFVIEPEGRIHKCWNLVGYNDLSIGCITKNSLTITNTELNDKWMEWSPFRDERCRKCNILPLCMGHCPFKDIFAPEMGIRVETKCPYWKFNLIDALKLYKKAKEGSVL